MEQPTKPLRRLIKRSQFQRAARGNRAGRSAFGLQAVPTDLVEPGVGFTVTSNSGTDISTISWMLVEVF